MTMCGTGLGTAEISPSRFDNDAILECLREFFDDKENYVEAEQDVFAPVSDELNQDLLYDGPHYFVVEGASMEAWEARGEIWVPGFCGRKYQLIPLLMDGCPGYSLEGADS